MRLGIIYITSLMPSGEAPASGLKINIVEAILSTQAFSLISLNVGGVYISHAKYYKSM